MTQPTSDSETLKDKQRPHVLIQGEGGGGFILQFKGF